jgi:TetR/AcrR family tetracycline transcriptional repressor
VKGLTREVLIEAGLKLLDEVGLDGLTVRRLAAELGVQSPALYWHIRTKQELLDGMANEIILRAGMGPPRADESWQEWLARRARSYRASLLASRDGARVVSGAVRGGDSVQHFERELAAMVERGFTPLQALRTITALSHYINGHVLQEQAVTAAAAATSAVAAPSAAATSVAAAPGASATVAAPDTVAAPGAAVAAGTVAVPGSAAAPGTSATTAAPAAGQAELPHLSGLPTLAEALRSGSPIGDDVFEHGLMTFIKGTEALIGS